MQRYEKYRESGMDWIGEIPENWEIVRFKRLFKEKKKTTDASLNSGSISFGEVIYKNDEKITEATKLSYQVLNEGEFLLNPLNMNYDLKSLRIGLSSINVVVSSGYIILQSKKGLNKNYYKWLLRVYDIVFMKTLGAGVRQTINYNDLADSHLVVPSLEEQQTIATFLDDKTSKIDQTIAIKEKEIELLKERRQILIQKAVTKGLDDTVKLKDSGVDWIGEIPEHWEVRKLKYFIQNLEGGVSVNASESESAEVGDFGVLKTSCVYNYYFDGRENKKVFENEKSRVSCQVRKGSIIISRMNAPELVGASGLVLEDYPNLFLPDRLWQTVYRKNISFDPIWLSKILINKGFRNFMTTFANGSSPSMKNISKGDFLNIAIPFSPISEQKKIITYLQEIEKKIDKAILLKQQEIEKLKEYKTVVIDNVVTGKVRVS